MLSQFRYIPPTNPAASDPPKRQKTGLDIDARVEEWLRDADDMRVLVFDTETTTLRGTIVQFACVMADQTGKEFKTYCQLWRTTEPIHPGATAIHHITTTDLLTSGWDRATELSFAIALLTKASEMGISIIGHNVSYDVDALARTAAKEGLEPPPNISTLCTMRGSRLFCGFTSKNGRSKSPTNEELFIHLFGKAPDARLHDALNDARVTLASFVEGRVRGWW